MFRTIIYIIAFSIMIVSVLSANDQNEKKYYLNDLELRVFMNHMQKELSLDKKQKKIISEKYHVFLRK